MAAKVAGCVFGGCIFCGTAYVVAVTVAPPLKYTVSDDHRINKFDELAPTYDRDTKGQEFYLGIGRMRRHLLKEAKGRVLEVGCGSASNLGLYPADQCDEVILCDRSPKMIEISRKKIEGRLKYSPYEYPHFPITEFMVDVVRKSAKTTAKKDEKTQNDDDGSSSSFASPVTDQRLMEIMQNYKGVLPIDPNVKLTPQGIAALGERAAEIERRRSQTRPFREERAKHTLQKPVEEVPQVLQDQLYSLALYPAEHLPFADNTFDTVVDMFGVCSFDNPVVALREMSRVCKPDGKLLLLEHGKGTWERLNDYLDKFAPRHAKMWGCWWNRDIRRSVRLAGLVPEPESRSDSHFGTTMMMVCKPYKHAKIAAARK